MRKLSPVGVVAVLSLSALASAQWPNGEPTWAFEPKRDDFRPDALLDLRSLNEKVAGESGFVRSDANGDFVLGNGKPVRFWCVNTGVGRDKPWRPRPLGPQAEPDLAHHARFLAKRGVNMVRLHAHVNPGPNQPVDAIREGERDWIWRTVATMKKEGIYTTISPYWAIEAKIGKDWGIPTGGQENAAALVFFEPKLQAAYRTWLRKLFAEKNPHTGISLAEDPSVALIQLQNEDSLLFWTINALKGEPRRLLGKQFGDWAKAKYGSFGAMQTAWDGNKLVGDDLAAGVLDFHNVWEMTQVRTGGMKRRLDDQTQFWGETMYRFNRETAEFLRKDLGCKQLINAGNWRTADSARLNDVERWSYTANEVDAVNRYMGGVHKGPNEGWAIQNGDKFTSPSLLKDPLPLALNLKQTAGRPMLVTESAWVMPTGYQSEGPFLIATYQSVGGTDGYYWFATGDDEWSHPQSANGYNPSQMKWIFANPDMLGTFPGAALMYRKGYVKRASPVVVEHRALKDLWERRTPLVFEEMGFDPNRDMGDVAPASSVKAPVDPLAFLVGPVQVAFGSDPAKTKVANLAPYASRSGEWVRSTTGEVTLNYGKGFCTVDAPAAQGVAAFFRGSKPFALKDVTFQSKNEYGAALAISMDGKPVKTSAKVLVQFGTRSRPTEWADRPVAVDLDGGKKTPGYEVVNYGKAPWQVAQADLTVTIRNPKLRTATVLDINGSPAGTVALTRNAKAVNFRFPKNAMYVVLR
ncbi:MAG: hypothetical protein ACO1SV_12980 [Fimbriimonas sp.]